MRDITKLQLESRLKGMDENISVMIHETKSTLEATQRVVKILDAKFEKADFHAVVANNYKQLSVLIKKRCWRSSLSSRIFLMEQ